MSRENLALFGPEKNIIKVPAKFKVYWMGIWQENIMGAVRINFASLVLFYNQYKHQNGRKVVKMYPFLVLALVAKQNYSCKIGADCTHSVLLSKTQPVNLEFCEYFDYIFLGSKKSRNSPWQGTELCKILKCFKSFLRKKVLFFGPKHVSASYQCFS